MYTNDKLNTDIQNLSTTIGTNPSFIATLETFNDDNDMKPILSYAIPLSCLAIMMVLLITVGIYRRKTILEKWTSLKRMKNTDPRLYERSGLRRDSEYEAESGNFESITTINEDERIEKESEYKVSTIT